MFTNVKSILPEKVHILYLLIDRPVAGNGQTGLSSGLKSALTFGVPIVFAMLCVTVGVLLMVWAVRKGK